MTQVAELEVIRYTHREAKAKTGKNTPRQCLRVTSSSVVGLYHSSRSLRNSLALRTRPDNNNLASPSAATLRRSLLCKEYVVDQSLFPIVFLLFQMLIIYCNRYKAIEIKT